MISAPRLLSITLFLVAGACGGGGSGSGGGALNGMVHGQSIMIDDAISAAVTGTLAGSSIHGAAISMANAKDLCSDATSNTSHPNEEGVVILLTDINGGTSNTPTATGTYVVGQASGTPAKIAFFAVSVTDATCKHVSAQSASATSGTVTLTSISGNRFSGNFDLVLDSGDHVTGSFDPQECPDLNTQLNNSNTSSCI